MSLLRARVGVWVTSILPIQETSLVHTHSHHPHSPLRHCHGNPRCYGSSQWVNQVTGVVTIMKLWEIYKYQLWIYLSTNRPCCCGCQNTWRGPWWSPSLHVVFVCVQYACHKCTAREPVWVWVCKGVSVRVCMCWNLFVVNFYDCNKLEGVVDLWPFAGGKPLHLRSCYIWR